MIFILYLLIFGTSVISSAKDLIIIPKATYYFAYNNSITASGNKVIPSKVNSGEHRWIAISRDLKKYYCFGDTVIVNSKHCPDLNGEWVVNDLMGPKWKCKIDFLISPDSEIKNKFLKPHRVIIKKKNKSVQN